MWNIIEIGRWLFCKNSLEWQGQKTRIWTKLIASWILHFYRLNFAIIKLAILEASDNAILSVGYLSSMNRESRVRATFRTWILCSPQKDRICRSGLEFLYTLPLVVYQFVSAPTTQRAQCSASTFRYRIDIEQSSLLILSYEFQRFFDVQISTSIARWVKFSFPDINNSSR